MQMLRCLRRFWSLLVGQAASTLWVVSALFLHVKGLAVVQVPPTQAHLELNSSLRGSLSSAKWGENLVSWFAILINLRNFVTFRGGSSSTMAEIFSRSGCMPLSSITCPRNLIFLWLNWHFSAFKVTPTFSIRSSYQA